ncbi:MAG: germination protein YpeB [Alicyclobacillus sp.]|nr:germination protein YpeB [Alicyclobacillus sp.]
MLHRATWAAIPIVGLVLAGSGLGWWGYTQYQQRQALAVQTENQYENIFHTLASELSDLQTELGKAQVSSNGTGFQSRLRNIWRLAFAAQTDASRLPLDLMPLHNVQQFLANVGDVAEGWMKTGANPTDPAVHQKLATLYQQAEPLTTTLQSLQAKVLDDRMPWLAVTQALRSKKGDNQVVDGFRKMDTMAAGYVESQQKVASPLRPDTTVLAKEATVDEAGAVRSLRSFLQLPANLPLRAAKTGNGAKVPAYTVSGQLSYGTMTAQVSQQGGHVLSLSVQPSPAQGEVDFSAAEDKALQWLNQRGFGPVEVNDARQYDSTGYYVFVPVRNGAQVISQTIAVKVDLHTGQIIGYDGSNYYLHPVTQLPARQFTTAQLQQRLNPALHVEMAKEVVLEDADQHWVPAVAFYGTANDETYCVYMNAVNGQEIEIDRLS